MVGKQRRLRRIFGADGRTLIVAMDHAAPMGPVKGLVDPASVIRTVVGAGADAILTTYGTATRCVDAFDGRGLVLRLIDGQELGVEEAIRVGADAVMSMHFVGDGQASTERHSGRLSVECAAWGMPLATEVLAQVEDADASERAWLIAKGCRASMELGADLVKTVYTGDQDSFARVVAGTHLPIVVLGGQRMSTDEQVLVSVREALDAGAAGVAIGRNIWQHERPERMVAALGRLVHGDASVSQALSELASVSA
jgi:DhnA family fructose-bisphosphate aldolase class Ia